MKIFKVISVLLLASSATMAFAQGGTKSPYSMYGIGILADQSQGFNRAMSGVSQGFRFGNQVNVQNPASYSNVDSLSFIFDIGLTLQKTSYKEGANKIVANDANFEYAVAAFRVIKHLGVSFGILPFSNIGYDFTTAVTQTGMQAVEDKVTTNYIGSGGMRQVYLGAGWNPIKPISIGFNMSYLWGDYNKIVSATHSLATATSLYRLYETKLSSYKLDLGLQFVQPIDKKNTLVVGGTYSLGHNLHNEATLLEYQTDTTTYSIQDALSLPHIISAGLAWHHGEKWSIGADFSLYKFGKLDYPEIVDNAVGMRRSYIMQPGLLRDRQKIAIGGEYVPDAHGRDFLSRVHYRIGGYYATPYTKLKTATGLTDGPKEMGLSFGFGIPIINSYTNRSLLNISGQWVRQSVSNYIYENYFRINVAMTFNERWFAKWKVE